jgi:hypothetical protein
MSKPISSHTRQGDVHIGIEYRLLEQANCSLQVLPERSDKIQRPMLSGSYPALIFYFDPNLQKVLNPDRRFPQSLPMAPVPMKLSPRALEADRKVIVAMHCPGSLESWRVLKLAIGFHDS